MPQSVSELIVFSPGTGRWRTATSAGFAKSTKNFAIAVGKCEPYSFAASVAKTSATTNGRCGSKTVGANAAAIAGKVRNSLKSLGFY